MLIVIKKHATKKEIEEMAKDLDGYIKVVVDVERKSLAVDAELHSDLEALLLQDGSKQKNLWGINLYPEMQGNDFIECTLKLSDICLHDRGNVVEDFPIKRILLFVAFCA